jgi:hypothetical protein
MPSIDRNFVQINKKPASSASAEPTGCMQTVNANFVVTTDWSLRPLQTAIIGKMCAIQETRSKCKRWFASEFRRLFTHDANCRMLLAKSLTRCCASEFAHGACVGGDSTNFWPAIKSEREVTETCYFIRGGFSLYVSYFTTLERI